MQKKIFLTLILTLTFVTLQAQQTKSAQPNTPTLPLKIGYTNIEYILSFLPETKKIESEYTSFEKQLQNNLQTKLEELQQKFQDYQQRHKTMTEAVKNQQQAELQQLQKNLEQLQVESQEKLANKHTSLLKPVYEKIQSKIEQIAKAEGYTYIFNANTVGMPVLLYVSEEHNISEKVVKLLGINTDKNKK